MFAQDKINFLKLSNQEFCIINLDFSSEEGSHWIGIKLNNNVLEIYDSLGMTSDGWYRPPFFFLIFSLSIVTHIKLS